MSQPRVVVESVEETEQYLKPSLHPHAKPEEVALLALREQNALKASADLFRMLATPRFMQRWVTFALHTRSDGNLGNNGAKTATEYVSRLFEVVLCADLDLEVSCTVGMTDSWKLFPFGSACRHIQIPAKLFSDDPAFMASLLRIVLADQSGNTSSPFSAYGGAFTRTQAVMDSNSAHFSKFSYNKLLDFHFPRIQFIACYCATLASHTRFVDINRGIDPDRVLAIGNPMECIGLAQELRYGESESVPVRLLLKNVFEKLLGDFTARLQQFHLIREELSSFGKPVTHSMYRQRIPESNESITRRADFYLTYVNKLHGTCELPSEKSQPILFAPKHLTALWLAIHYDSTERAQIANSLKLSGFYSSNL